MIDKIEKNWTNVQQGKLNCIPFDLPRLNKYIPGIVKGIPITIAASTGVDACPCI